MMPSHRPSWLNGSNVDLSGEAACPELASYSWRRSCSPQEIPRAGDIQIHPDRYGTFGMPLTIGRFGIAVADRFGSSCRGA